MATTMKETEMENLIGNLRDCHGQARQEQGREGKVWFIVNCRLRNKRGKDPSCVR
jgi:hypothetical protein